MQADVMFGKDGGLSVRRAGWAGFRIENLRPVIQVDGVAAEPVLVTASRDAAVWSCAGWHVQMSLTACGEHGRELRVRLVAATDGVLNRVELIAGGTVAFGADPARVRILSMSRYGGDVVPLSRIPAKRAAGSGEPNETAEAGKPSTLWSENVTVIHDRSAGQSLLIGFLSSERWSGGITFNLTPQGGVHYLAAGFDGGDLQVRAGEALELEPLVVMDGRDPFALLEEYGDMTGKRHGVVCADLPPVSWCSWYPFRLGVSEDRLLSEARIAAERLKPLGLGIMEADLGWERQHLPHVFEPNEKFSHGLAWLADRLGEMGFEFGVWKAPFTISAFDALAKEHPEWVIHGDDGKPISVWTWFWEPHGDVYILDLSHPCAQQWLRENMARLRKSGLRYFKADFIGMASDARAKRRYDSRIVSGSGTEAARIGARIIREELPDAFLLNCGGPPMPGTGAWPLLYVCNDTGNTGLQSWEFARANFRAAACHLWQNRRWGILQTSCLCVGLPGSLEEARLRATVAFLSGGQVDISDTFSSLPEDRWAVLEATLPPLGITARPIDLFEPVLHRQAADYEALCKGLPTAYEEREHPPGSVWQLSVKRDWDDWTLVACFAFDQKVGDQRPDLNNFTIPLGRLGLEDEETCWAFEFWSGQFLGLVPGGRTNPNQYAHPGDWQDLVTAGPAGTLSFTFTGPGVKLIALRRPRLHPWVVGTSFHQSCGAELSGVAWDPKAGGLSGQLNRPAGQIGYIILAATGWSVVSADVGDRPAGVSPAAGGGYRLAICSGGPGTRWRVQYAKG